MFPRTGERSAGSRYRSAVVATALLALGSVAALPIAAYAQGLTEQQMIEQLLGKATRGTGPAKQAAPPPARTLSTSETDRLRALLEKAGTRAFSAKERTEVAEAVRDRPSLDFEIYFPFNSSGVQQSAVETLQRIGRLLSNDAFKDRGFLIAGHTDAKGSAEANQAISLRRAESVKAWLVKNFNIDPSRLRVIGYGKEQLKDEKQPFASINRRVQIINLPDGTLTASR